MDDKKLLDTTYNYILNQEKNKEYYTEKVLNKPKRAIAEILNNARISQKISSRELENALKNQDFNTSVSYSTYLGIINKQIGYSIDSLLRILDVLDLELIIKQKD